MKVLRRNLDPVKSLLYIKENLREINRISDAVIKYVDFTKGDFFTLLPDDAQLERIYEFKYGHMIPQVPYIEKMSEVPGLGFVQVVDVINIDEEAAEFIHRFLKKTNTNVGCFDYFCGSPTSKHIKNIWSNCFYY